MEDLNEADLEFNRATNRLLHREALRRAAQDLNTMSGPGLEGIMERISAEATADAMDRIAVDQAQAEREASLARAKLNVADVLRDVQTNGRPE